MKLMKRLADLKAEKENLANEVEQEEEFLINNLQKRLTKLNTEKADLEKQLESEQVLLQALLCLVAQHCVGAEWRVAWAGVHSRRPPEEGERLTCLSCVRAHRPG